MFILLSFCLSLSAAAQSDGDTDSVEVEDASESSAQVPPEAFVQAVLALNAPSFSDKAAAVETLKRFTENERTTVILQAMMDGYLDVVKGDNSRLVIEVDQNNKKTFFDAISGEELMDVEEKTLDKVRTNNRLRREIRTAIAGLELGSPSIPKRLSAAKNLIKNGDTELLDFLKQARDSETVDSVKESLVIAVAIIEAQDSNNPNRVDAVNILAGALEPQALTVLNQILLQDDEGNYLEQDQALIDAALAAKNTIERSLSFYRTLENLYFGISLGSVLLIAAVGLAITFGVMGVINMAHGEMIMLGAYTTFFVQQLFPNAIGVSLFIAIPAAFLVSGSVGVLIERVIIRHLYGRPLETLLATFGVSLFLQQLARTYNSNNVPVITPDWMSGSFEINAALSLTFNRFYIIWFAMFVILLLMFITRRTFFGLQMRAVTQNRPMANSMGIRSGWVDAMTFGLGSGIAGIAGVALSQLTNVGPNLGQGYIIDSFMVVVFGGVGNLLGTVFAALSLGIINKFLEPVAGAVLGKIIVLIFIILFIQWRPRGLFALKGRAVED